ncbi:MAG TPA: hypothetical protein VFW13_10625, partial [Phenylobacterium sp.]|nr:hypothetical protein [Phenylobacterium sp.]
REDSISVKMRELSLGAGLLSLALGLLLMTIAVVSANTLNRFDWWMIALGLAAMAVSSVGGIAIQRHIGRWFSGA